MTIASQRIGIISDIHGSLIPLELGCDFLKTHGVDRIICAGDVVSFGPDPNEVVSWMRANGIQSVKGNEDESMLTKQGETSTPADEPALDGSPETPGQIQRRREIATVNDWSRSQLTQQSLKWLAALPLSLKAQEGFLCVHAAPGDTSRIVTPQSELPFPSGTSCVCAGHLHQPFIVHRHQKIWANVGSLARPMDGDPRGSLAIASLTGTGWSVEHFRIELPIDEICRRIQSAGMPFADRLCETQRLACRW